jgi:hypothetical protein
MNVRRMKSLASVVGGASIVAAIGVCLLNSTASKTDHIAGGPSDDGSTTGRYTQPVLPAMSLNPTDLSTGATATAQTPAATLATSAAAPTFKATPPPGF